MWWIIIIIIVLLFISSKKKKRGSGASNTDPQKMVAPFNRVKYVEITYHDKSFKEFKLIHEVSVTEKVPGRDYSLFVDSSIFADNVKNFKLGFELLDENKSVLSLQGNWGHSYEELDDCGIIHLYLR